MTAAVEMHSPSLLQRLEQESSLSHLLEVPDVCSQV